MTAVFLFLLVVLASAAAFSPARWIGGSRTSVSRATPLKAVKLVVADETEPIENVLKRFKRAVNQSGHLMELRHRELWETAADKRKRKAERARQLNRIERTNDRYERKNDGASEYNS